jgi:hypothetical protein
MGGQRFRDEGCIISAPWATIFRGHPSEDVMTSHPSLKRMADKSGLAGIVQEHTEQHFYVVQLVQNEIDGS